MNINNYPEIKPGKKPFKKIYVSILLWIIGRAIQASVKIDKEIQMEFSNFPDDFMLGIMPNGPYMIVGKNKNGKIKYKGRKINDKMLRQKIWIKNIEAAIQIFTFQESTTTAYARNRLYSNGDIPHTLAVIRIVNIIEIYLLPKIIAKLAVRRYPAWSEMSPLRKHLGRILIYAGVIIGF